MADQLHLPSADGPDEADGFPLIVEDMLLITVESPR